jgi:hypothetical protein
LPIWPNISAVVTSTMFPRLTMRLNPTPEPTAQSITAAAMAPDCETNAMSPGRGIPTTNVVLSGVYVSMVPMQFGPITRTPYCSAMRLISCSRASPSGPVSRNPPLTMIAALMPRRPHASTWPATAAAGTTITAMSTGSGTSSTLG